MSATDMLEFQHILYENFVYDEKYNDSCNQFSDYCSYSHSKDQLLETLFLLRSLLKHRYSKSGYKTNSFNNLVTLTFFASDMLWDDTLIEYPELENELKVLLRNFFIQDYKCPANLILFEAFLKHISKRSKNFNGLMVLPKTASYNVFCKIKNFFNSKLYKNVISGIGDSEVLKSSLDWILQMFQNAISSKKIDKHTKFIDIVLKLAIIIAQNQQNSPLIKLLQLNSLGASTVTQGIRTRYSISLPEDLDSTNSTMLILDYIRDVVVNTFGMSEAIADTILIAEICMWGDD